MARARWSVISWVLTACFAFVGCGTAGQPKKERLFLGGTDWPAYGGGPEQSRYSRLSQINSTNVSQLDRAWTYDTREAGGFQTQPIVVDGVMYGVTPKHEAIALDGETGALIWRFDSGLESSGPNRGVTYWRGDGGARLFVAVDTYVYALDATTGVPIATFGAGGRLDLRDDLGRDPTKLSVRLTTPGIIYNDTIIIGGRLSESLGAPPGDIRAYDVRSGQLKWRFRTIPRPGEEGYDTWPPDAWTYSGGANNWAGMSLDTDRGIVYVPTGSATADHYGADRVGDNLFANCLLALDARTGARLWHFQTVHHDLWDRDLAAPPNLVTVTRGGRPVDAVAQVTKHGFVFLFDRVTGIPLFPIEERPVSVSTVDGEVAAATQPTPLKPAPFARQGLVETSLTRRTPQAAEAARTAFSQLTSGGQFVPLEVGRATVVFPGFDGGAEWGGAAFDPTSGLLYVNSNDVPWTGSLTGSTEAVTGRGIYLSKCAVCHGDDLRGAPPQVPSLLGLRERFKAERIAEVVRVGVGRMAGQPDLNDQAVDAVVHYLSSGEDKEITTAGNGTRSIKSRLRDLAAYLLGWDKAGEVAAPTAKYRFTGYKKFLDIDGYPAVSPPWGTLNAINLNTGEYAWTIPLGEYPALVAAGIRNTGSENYGGPLVTAGGLLFIGATSYDKKFRAFDKATGRHVWEATLPFAGNATPITYEINGRQFIVIAAGGGKASSQDSGGVYVAFALPANNLAGPRIVRDIP